MTPEVGEDFIQWRPPNGDVSTLGPRRLLDLPAPGSRRHAGQLHGRGREVGRASQVRHTSPTGRRPSPSSTASSRSSPKGTWRLFAPSVGTRHRADRVTVEPIDGDHAGRPASQERCSAATPRAGRMPCVGAVRQHRHERPTRRALPRPPRRPASPARRAPARSRRRAVPRRSGPRPRATPRRPPRPRGSAAADRRGARAGRPGPRRRLRRPRGPRRPGAATRRASARRPGRRPRRAGTSSRGTPRASRRASAATAARLRSEAATTSAPASARTALIVEPFGDGSTRSPMAPPRGSRPVTG